MLNKRDNSRKTVFFNASVVLAGLKSTAGGSGKILSWSRGGNINGITSEIVIDEAARNAAKVGVKPAHFRLMVKTTFNRILAAPEKENVVKFAKMVIDAGDAHILASCYQDKADFLVTLDKKHLLILQKKIKWVKIVSPGELLGAVSSP